MKYGDKIKVNLEDLGYVDVTLVKMSCTEYPIGLLNEKTSEVIDSYKSFDKIPVCNLVVDFMHEMTKLIYNEQIKDFVYTIKRKEDGDYEICVGVEDSGTFMPIYEVMANGKETDKIRTIFALLSINSYE